MECLNQSSRTLLIVAHGQTIRCLLADKLNIDMHEALQIKVPHAVPIVLMQSKELEWRPEPWRQ